MANTPQFGLRLDPELKARAQAEAKKRGQSLAAFIKDAILAHLEVALDAGDSTCPHTDKRILAYGSWCKACGKRLR